MVPRGDNSMVPRGDTWLHAGDILVLISSKENQISAADDGLKHLTESKPLIKS